MFYVYILKEEHTKHFYIGSTNNLRRRLVEHKENLSRSTRGRIWRLNCYFSFGKEDTARNFEKYLKTGSGRAFCKKHFEFKIDEA